MYLAVGADGLQLDRKLVEFVFIRLGECLQGGTERGNNGKGKWRSLEAQNLPRQFRPKNNAFFKVEQISFG